jgi:pimeloyl-ACP methyl ester carboxylesterase
VRKGRFLRVVSILLIVFLLVLFVGPFLVPIPPLHGTKAPQELADSDSQFLEINGLSVHVKKIGQGNIAFILLHGFGASLFSWHAVMQPLSQFGTVIAYDRPAFGLTERPMEWEGENPYGTQANVDLLLGVIDHYGLDKVILVGNSAGGTVAMNFYLQHKAKVQALILVDPAVYEDEGRLSWLGPILHLPQIQHLGPLFVRSIQERGLDLIKMAWYDPSQIPQETWDGYTKPLSVTNWDKSLWYFTIAGQAGNLFEHLDKFTLPILVITGDTDRIVPTEYSVRLAMELPNATLEIIPQAGHVPHEERPALFMKGVVEFLETIP